MLKQFPDITLQLKRAKYGTSELKRFQNLFCQIKFGNFLTMSLALKVESKN